MFRKNKLSYAVAAAMGATIATGANAQLEEIIVTATKQAESAQDIPVAVQATSGDTIEDLGIQTFDKYVQYLPNVVQQGRGPGQNEVFIRGVATEQTSLTVSSIQGTSPQVALYVDEQPVSFGGRNLDVYATDLERVEVLAGPQGTLFGASSQSGTIRLITNKPSLDGFEAGFRASQGFITDGEEDTAISAYFNVPLTEKLAVRATLYNDEQGGWIDNVQAQFNSDTSQIINVINRNQISGASAIAADADIAIADNSAVVEEDFNRASYRGARFGVYYEFNDDWNAVVQHTTQSLNTEGAFEFAPFLEGNDEQANQIFSPNNNEDEFGLTTWTLTGRVGNLDLVYTGGYLDREIEVLSDYTNYTFGGGYQAYYICNTPYAAGGATECFNPIKQYLGQDRNTRLTNEFRFSTDPDKRIRLTAGVYSDIQETTSIGEFQYFGAVEAGFNSANLGGQQLAGNVEGVNRNGPIGADVISTFVNDFTRDEEQIAGFGEISFDLTDDLTLTLGARHYSIDFELAGSTASSFGCKGVAIPDGANPGDIIPGTAGTGSIVTERANGTLGCDATAFDNDVTARLSAFGAAQAGDLSGLAAALDPSNPAGRTFNFNPNNAADAALLEDIQNGDFAIGDLDSNGVANQRDTLFKATLGWKASENILLFGTFSQGFRPQVTNRNAGAGAGIQEGPFEGFRVPVIANTDELDNFEIGFKGDLFNDQLRLNATAYFSDISDLQVNRFDPTNVAFLVFVENIGDAEVLGLDLDFQWFPIENLAISGALALVDSEITSLNPVLEGVAVPVGSRLPFTADFSFNLNARYTWEVDSFGGDAYVQGGVVFTGDRAIGIQGNAFFVEDTTQRLFGNATGLEIEGNDTTFGSDNLATEAAGSIGTVPFDSDGDGVDDETRFQNGRFVAEEYAIFNFAIGAGKDGWNAELFIDNVFDERGVTHISTADFVPTVSTTRPRTVGVRLSYDFQ